MSEQRTMRADELPPPETLIECAGGPMALMFFYAPADTDLGSIASEQGFNVRSIGLAEDHPLYDRYEHGDDILSEWHPTVPPGWLFGAKCDTEDGLYAVFIRRRSETP